MLSIRLALAFLIFHPHLFSLSSPLPRRRVPGCHPEDLSALVRLRDEFAFFIYGATTDCCRMILVECDANRRIIGLQIFKSVKVPISSNSTLFSLIHLRHLQLSGHFLGRVPKEIARLSKLVSFKLAGMSGSGIDSGTFSALSRNLTELVELEITDVDMSSVPISSIVNLSSSLTTLKLTNCNLRGKLPERVTLFPNLENLLLSGNSIAGPIPLSVLNHHKLKKLDLSSNNLTGSVPEMASGSFPLLASLDLSFNSLNGLIPSWIYALPSLSNLDLSTNFLTGKIAEFKSSSLSSISLRRNKLHGVIPGALFQSSFSNISMFDLSSNGFTGNLSLEDLSKLENLSSFDVSSNHLTFRFDNSMNHTFHSLYFLGLSSCNITEFPRFLRSLTTLDTLDLSRNRICGTVPTWLWEMGKDFLFSLDLYHNFLTRMEPLPWNALQILDVRSNFLLGPLPISFSPSLYVLHASDNQLFGDLSASICDMTSLAVLNLAYNNLTGEIPPCLGNFNAGLSVVDLQKNNFHGPIPDSFAERNRLRTLNLNGNQFNGSLPRSLLNSKNLDVLDVGNNKISGPFPHWLTSLPDLQVLILRSNKFHGPISENTSSLPFQKLQIMDLSNNKFIGSLPETYFKNFEAMVDAHSGELVYLQQVFDIGVQYQDSVVLVIKGYEIILEKIITALATIDFSNNNLKGEIPNSITKLRSLKGLNFSKNRLGGPIPPSLGDLTNLEFLDLSSNELAGTIPWRLTDLDQLQNLNLSHNRLEGPIPTGKQFNTFLNESYRGNAGLCGFPVSKSCREDPEEDDDSGEAEGIVFEWKAAMMGYGSGVVIGASIGYMVLYTRSFHFWGMKRFGRKRRHITIVRVGGTIK